MVVFDYKENESWGNVGWLGSDNYYTFWGNVYTQKFAEYFENKIVLDIGAGNGRIWEEALKSGFKVKELHLIDPALNISPQLSGMPKVVEHRTTLDSIGGICGDVAIFKQSIHHVHGIMGAKMFDIIQSPLFINLSMPLKPAWPISPALMKKYKPSVLDVENTLKQSSKVIQQSLLVSYPVRMKRDDWCAMLSQRFTSILHDCDDAYIEREIEWVKQNQPDILEFNDTLECLVFR